MRKKTWKGLAKMDEKGNFLLSRFKVPILSEEYHFPGMVWEHPVRVTLTVDTPRNARPKRGKRP